MIGLIGSNLSRRWGRTLLTAMGIAVGVATIVALLSLTAGLKRTAGGLVHLGQADLGIFQKNAADPTASVIPDSLARSLRRRPEVDQTSPLLLVVEGIKRDPASVVFGAQSQDFFAQRLVYTAGVPPQGGREIVVGDELARALKLRVGSTLEVKKRRLRVSGIYHAGIFFEDRGAVMPLGAAQALEGRRGEATTIAVQLSPRFRAKVARQNLVRAFPSIQIIGNPDDAVRAGANSVLLGKGEFLIAVLALIVGGIGVTNTMLMAVLERQSEFALLATVGFSPRQVASLVLGEGLAVSLIGAAIGLVLGTAGSALLVKALAVSAYVTPDITGWGLGRGLIVGIAIGIFGGLYPAWRVTRLLPAESLARA